MKSIHKNYYKEVLSPNNNSKIWKINSGKYINKIIKKY